jgi:hypothetical protein
MSAKRFDQGAAMLTSAIDQDLAAMTDYYQSLTEIGRGQLALAIIFAEKHPDQLLALGENHRRALAAFASIGFLHVGRQFAERREA